MADAAVVEVAKAVVTELNGASLSQEFTAVRHYWPMVELKDMSALKVFVVARDVSIEAFSRGKTESEIEISVVVHQEVDPGDLTTVDGLMLLVQEMAEFFRLRRSTEYASAAWTGTRHAPLVSFDDLEERRLFTSVLVLTFSVVR